MRICGGTMKNLLDIFKTLSDETRLRLVILLYRQDHCVCELSEILDLPQPKISKHLTKLRDLGLVKTRREAQFIYYSLAIVDPFAIEVLQKIETHIKSYSLLYIDSQKEPSCKIDVALTRKEGE